ncbi:hypothetical protein FPSE_00274 [Fusarium pseudograminearum CS3096]|uniref:Uncharacterized protein n=1 Tax=Fusarium pseudograminearum (strain CS3096) TaxID=1028729 RepID=K3VV58_FUSPC|nr:hypothetical protein FPSE_00274 [Fusarium pseudograminearum CS3096]EKJ79589.1 hypothetical protein FPSE_00274 [Fusarium pseudograminearum CS3096]
MVSLLHTANRSGKSWLKTPVNIKRLFIRDVTPTICFDDCRARPWFSPWGLNLSQRLWRPDSKSGPDIATIVGPVVPSVVLLLLVGFLGLRWFKRRRVNKAATGPTLDEEEPGEYKPQLHSDCIIRPTFELEGSVPTVTDDTVHTKHEAEMAANEPAAHEMSGDKKISRKLVGLQVPGGDQVSEDRRDSTDLAE